MDAVGVMAAYLPMVRVSTAQPREALPSASHVGAILNIFKYFIIILIVSTNYIFVHLKIKTPTRCHLLFYCTSYRFNMFQASLCPSSGARDYVVDYHIGHFVL